MYKQWYVLSFVLIVLSLGAAERKLIPLGEYTDLEIQYTDKGIVNDVVYHLTKPVREYIQKKFVAVQQNPYKDKKACVRQGLGLSQQEKAFRKKRVKNVHAAQEKFLDTTMHEDDVLEIAFSCSGGGMRAMSGSYGYLLGAEKTGLLDTAMYISGLSGSTWFVGPLLSSGLDIDKYYPIMQGQWKRGLSITDQVDTEEVLVALLLKLAFYQPISLVDIYGCILGVNLLQHVDENQQMVHLSDQTNVIDNGRYPMPIYTSIIGNERDEHVWFEFTPYEAGTRWVDSGYFVPMWAFGRKFSDGISQDYAPEQPESTLLGVCGSAFAVNFDEAYEHIIKNIKPGVLKFLKLDFLLNDLKKIIKALVETEIGGIRVTSGKYYNFMKGIPTVSKEYLYKDSKLKLVDAGIDFGNPIFATYRKPPYGGAPDIIFVFDMSDYNLTGEPLKKEEAFAREHKLPFPKISYDGISDRVMTVFEDKDDVTIPVVIYMPCVKDQRLLDAYKDDPAFSYFYKLLHDFNVQVCIMSGLCGTFNLHYRENEGERLMAVGAFNVMACDQQIKTIMKRRLNAKRQMRLKREHKEREFITCMS